MVDAAPEGSSARLCEPLGYWPGDRRAVKNSIGETSVPRGLLMARRSRTALSDQDCHALPERPGALERRSHRSGCRILIVQGNARNVSSVEARAAGPGTPKGNTTGVAPARMKAWICSRHSDAEPTTPRPSRNRSEIAFTAPARSPDFHAALTASASSAYP